MSGESAQGVLKCVEESYINIQVVLFVYIMFVEYRSLPTCPALR